MKFDFEVKCDLKGHGRSSHKTIGILTKVFYIPGPNLVILVSTVNELTRRQRQFLKAKTSLWLKKKKVQLWPIGMIVDLKKNLF